MDNGVVPDDGSFSFAAVTAADLPELAGLEADCYEDYRAFAPVSVDGVPVRSPSPLTPSPRRMPRVPSMRTSHRYQRLCKRPTPSRQVR